VCPLSRLKSSGRSSGCRTILVRGPAGAGGSGSLAPDPGCRRSDRRAISKAGAVPLRRALASCQRGQGLRGYFGLKPIRSRYVQSHGGHPVESARPARPQPTCLR
jgi:hypothetical protein